MKIDLYVENLDNAAALRCQRYATVQLDFETDYLRGAVAAEIGGEIGKDAGKTAAAEAQAIAMRTNALRYIRMGIPVGDQSSSFQAFDAARMADTHYDVCYQAIRNTAGQVLYYDGKLLDTVSFSSNNGGRITSALERWPRGGGRPWLIEQDDPWDAATGKPKKGHGVGMSQLGAIYAAGKLGLSALDILTFYYPGTEVRTEYGEGGTVSEEAKSVIDQAENVSDQAETVIVVGTGKKTRMQAVIDFMRDQLGEPYDLGDHGPDRWDCSGLTMEAVEQIGLYWRHTSNGQWYDNIKTGGDFDAYGTLETLPPDTSAFLFHYGKRTNGEMGMVHVAVLDGANKGVIQAGGYKGSGVHENPYSEIKPHVTHWATIKGANELADSTAAPSGLPATLRVNNEGELVKALQNMLNKLGASLQEDGKFGPLTEAAVFAYQSKNKLQVDGIVGPETWRALIADYGSGEDGQQDAQEPQDGDNSGLNDGETPEALYTASVPNLTALQAYALVEQYPGTTVNKQG